MPAPLNKFSSRITQPKSQGASQAMLYGTGLTDDDMQKAQVGIASVWYDGNTCNMHLNVLAERVKEGVTGGRPRRHAVQHHRRQRRHLDGHRRDELLAPVARPDRRLDRNRHARPVVRRQHLASRLRQEHAGLPDRDGPPQPPVADGLRRHDPSRAICSRGCDGHQKASRSTSSLRFSATANSSRRPDRRSHPSAISSAIAMSRRRGLRRHVHRQHDGLGDRGAGHVAAVQRVDSRRRPGQDRRMCRAPERRSASCWSCDLKPRDIMTRRAFENAMVVVMALGGSTNAVLHLIAMARAVEVPLDDRRFPEGQRPRAVSCRPQAQRPLRAGRPAQSRRHARP